MEKVEQRKRSVIEKCQLFIGFMPRVQNKTEEKNVLGSGYELDFVLHTVMF